MTPRIQVLNNGGEFNYNPAGDTTDIALQVSTVSAEEINLWDKQRIVDSIILEAQAAPGLASEIADEVEKTLVASGQTRVTTSLIRELVDLQLMERGLSQMLGRHTKLGLPMFDVENIITQANKENSNTTHNPESINLTIAETVLKQYALERVFTDDIARAHYEGAIHLHDLGFIIRPYTYLGDTLVRTEDGRDVSLADLYDEYPLETAPEPGTFVKYPKDGLRIRDRNSLVGVKRLVKREKGDKRMFFIKCEDGRAVVVTHDHPMLVEDGGKYRQVKAMEVEAGDMLSTCECTTAAEPLKSLNMVEELVEAGIGSRYRVVLRDGSSLPVDEAHRHLAAGKMEYSDLDGAAVEFSKHTERSLPVTVPLTSDLGWLVGFVIGDGHRGQGTVEITCGDNDYLRKLKDILDSMGYSYQEIDREGGKRIRIYSTMLNDLLWNVMEIGDSARTKKLPRFYSGYCDEFLAGVVAGVIDSDGTVEKNGISIRVASSKLTAQLYEVLSRLGYRPSMRRPAGAGSKRTYKGRVIEQKFPIFGVYFAKTTTNTIPSIKYGRAELAKMLFIKEHSDRSKVVQVCEVEMPDRFIYDVTTESGTFIANGIYSKNCGGHSLEYVKKFGLRLPNITSTSSPAKHANVLIGHMVKMASTLQSYYAGAIGWEAVNVFFAPFLVGMPYERIKQLAQMLIFEFNQLAGARGSQVVFTDFNLYWNVPRHLKEAPAIGPGGLPTGQPYSKYEKEAQLFLKALFEIYLEGDAMGKTFVFPKPLLHINDDFFKTEGWEEFLELACEVASAQGITYFVFDRGDEVTVSQCCRLKLKLREEDLIEAMTPEKMRFSALQNITINLPRIAYRAHGSDEMLFSELETTLELVARAHVQKQKFIVSLMELGQDGPVSLLCMELDGEPYLKVDRLTYLAGLLGLNEMVQYHKGVQLHESPEALRFGLKVVAHMALVCERLSEKFGISIVLEESPAESSGYRLAKLDMKYFPEQAGQVVKGSLEDDQYYYTNSIHLATDAPIDYVERVQKQSLFHPLIKAGAIIHVWLGEHKPPAASIMNFVEKIFWDTNAAQVAFSPEFTVCNTCSSTSRGLSEECPLCGSTDTYGITRIVGYYSKVSTWNKGKLGELAERNRTSLMGGDRDVVESIRERRLSKLSGG